MEIRQGIGSGLTGPITTDMFLQFGRLKHNLREIFFDLIELWPADEVIITSIWRPKTTDSGVHALYRGIDVRIINLGSSYQYTADHISMQLNERWSYDSNRPHKMVAYSKPHGSGPHIHLQSHPNTRRRLVED